MEGKEKGPSEDSQEGWRDNPCHISYLSPHQAHSFSVSGLKSHDDDRMVMASLAGEER